MSREVMVLKAIHKTNKLKFLYGKNDFLTPAPRRLLCNGLILSHLDYVCSNWYPDLTKKFNSNHSKRMYTFLLAVR